MWKSEHLLTRLHHAIIYRAIETEASIIAPAGNTVFHTHSGAIPMKLEQPIYVMLNAKLSKKQASESIVLILSSKDLKTMDTIMTKHNTHSGAFGSDHDTFKNASFPNHDKILWKLPGDIFDIESFDGNLKSLINRNFINFLN